MAITREQDNLIKEMVQLGYNEETTAGIATFLKEKTEISRMLTWLKNNPQDNQEALNEMGRILRMRATDSQASI